mgnify:CR=1 FL=1
MLLLEVAEKLLSKEVKLDGEVINILLELLQKYQTDPNAGVAEKSNQILACYLKMGEEELIGKI